MKINYSARNSFGLLDCKYLKHQNLYSLIKIVLLLFVSINSNKTVAQCLNYQVYESFSTAIPTSGGTWTDNSMTYTTVAAAYSGFNELEFNAVGDYIQTPMIATPGSFSFYHKRNGVSAGAPKFTVLTSPDGTTWTARGSVTPGIAWVKYTVNLSALGLTNVYVRILDERTSGTDARWVDDVAWTSTVSSENTIIPLIANTCAQTINCGTTYSFTDQGGFNDAYNISKDYTITFTPSVGTNKVELTFNTFDLQSGEDGMVIYNGPTTASPVISSGLPVGTNATNCPAGSFYGTNSPGTITSTDASGAITIRFRSSGAINNSGWLAGVTCISPSGCQKPTLTPTTAITSTTATLNWAAPSPAPASGYEYVYSTANLTPSGSGTFTAGTSASISGLTPNTVYYVFVRSDCGSGVYSGWTSSGTFTTLYPPCVAPVAQANTFVSGTITATSIAASFSGSANGYLVVQSTSATPPSQPVDGTIYTAGNIATLGAGLTFIQSNATTTFTATALQGNTNYYYFIYAYNNTTCSGGPTYNVSGPLNGSGVTCTAIPNTVGTASVTSSGFVLNWTAPTGGSALPLSYTVQITTDAGYTANIAGSPFTINAPTTTLSLTGLNSNTTYYYRILASNGCASAYVTGNVVTLLPNCVAPVSQASAFVLGTPTSSTLPASFSGSANGYLVVSSLTNTPPSQPVNGTTYSGANVGTLGAGFTFVQSSASTAIAGTGLAANTQYYYFIYAFNNTACLGGPVYNSLGPLVGSGTTLPPFNDECTTAITLTVGSSCTYTTYSNATATTSSTTGTPAPGCASYLGNDVWFKAVVPANGTLILDMQTGSMLDSGMAIYSGSCGGLTLIECDDDDSNNGAMSYINRSGLTPGSTIYIRVWEFSNDNNGTFGICASTPSPCVAPASQASGFTLGTPTATALPFTFSGTADQFLVVRSLTNTPPAQPTNGTIYNAGNIASLGGGLTFIQNSATPSVNDTSVNGNTRYYYFIYAYNNAPCTGGPIYNASGALSGNGLTCVGVPNSVTTSNLTATSFTLNWVQPVGGVSAAINYTVQITTDAGYSANIPGSPFSVANPTVLLNVTGLTTATTYYYRILASNGCNSAYVNGNITTSCTAANIPYTQNFDSVTQPAIPACLATENTNGDTKFWKTCNSTSLGNATAINPVSGTNQMGIQYDTANAMNDWFYLRGLNLTGGTAYRLTFYTRAYTYTGENELLEIKYGTSPSSSSMTTTLMPTFAVLGNDPYIQKTVDFMPSSSGIYYIGFHGVSPADVWYLFVDDVTVTLSPSCLTPTLTDTTNITTSSATINWSAPLILPSNGYQYYVSTSSTTPTVPGIATTALTANLTGLTASTTYYVFVRSDCGGTFSSWTAAGSFYTGYCIATSTSTGYYINNFSTTGGIANITNNSSGLSASGYGNFTAQTVSQQPYGVVNFSSAYVGGTFGFNIWIDWNNDLDFSDPGEKVYGSGNFNTANTGSFTVPASATVGSHRMRIRANYYDTNPQQCGSITYGETEDYTFTVVALPCAGNPTLQPATGIGFTTATLNWTAASPAPASGYEYIYSTSATDPVPATTPTGSTGAGVTTVNLTGLTSGMIYYVWVRSNCGANKGVWTGPISFITNAAPPVTTNGSTCAGGTATLTATGSCTNLTNLGNTINGAWDATGDPRAIRPIIFMANSSICEFDGNGLTANYTSMDFQVSATGFYTFTMAATTAYDGMGYIVINPFNPGYCGSGTWIVGDDDSGPTTYEPMMSATLNAGVTYTLISTLYSGSSITLTNTFQWNVTGPGTISGVVGGTVEWYTAASGGIPIGTGTPFNPVGVSGSGLTNTNSPGTYPFYAACPNNPTVRSLGNFVVNGPTAVISGSGSTCTGSVPMSITFTGTGPWNFTYTDGTTPVTVNGNTTNPYLFSVAPSTPRTYTLTALSDANCSALSSNMTGSGTVTASKSWNGTTSDWNTASNWNPVGIPTATDCVVIPNTTIDPIISGSSYNAYAYSLTILNGGILQVNSGNNITVTDIVNVATGGQFNLSNSASLVQINNVANIGTINVERITQPMYRFDYTYWGCPVTFASNFTLGMLSPNTLSDKFYSWTPTVGNSFGNWFSESTATIMNPIKGYIVRAPQSFSFTPTVFTPYTANFIGTPNNGDILCPIYHGTLGPSNNNDKYNLLGNPYPSAVDAQAFLTDPANTPIIDGTIYFWTHNSAPSTAYVDPFYGDFVINYTDSDYASWNSLGPVGSRGSAALSGGATPNGFIGTGQGFFTKSTGTAPSGNPVTFKNSMRVTGNNGQFFRLTNQPEKHRVWLNLLSHSGTFNQILIGYINDATEGWDRNYDGVRFTDNSSSTFYSVIPDRELVIQGRPLPFNDTDQVPLGFKATAQDMFSLRLDHFDGLFENQAIYVEDTYLNTIHNLKDSPYIFSSEIGNFNNRLVLRYTNSTLATNLNQAPQEVIAFINKKQLVIEAARDISQVEVHDLAGKLVYRFNPRTRTSKINEPFDFAQGVYMVKIYLENQIQVSKKLMNHYSQ
ncbi:T9SS type A sorting domain-containing protein [Flavobacterium sp. CYK-4]|uniref:fibronectin type III domain-containing protein n=1 Tax=Flavobacterium lotistagni TaxID=2709660 RepID=UPI00140CE33D|nr:fibronectin type III domain-containing protein [Flavobacterium lotistagni]NHM06534.1 T9SS type A sorting domain-containing protein [Flavobacterium lotistagni]